MSRTDRQHAAGPPQQHVLADGRCLSYRIFGDRDGTPVLALHGTPGSSLKFAIADELARQRRIALVSLDRWGYAATGAPPVPALSLFAVDAGALMGMLGFDRFAVLGVSGGGPFAAAVAAGLPQRVSAAALVAPVGEIAPLSVGRAEIGLFHAFCFRVLASWPAAVRAIFLGFSGVLAVAPEIAIRLAAARATPADRRIIASPDAARHLAAAFRDGLAGSAMGPALDLALFRMAWDFDVASIACPTRVWIGSADRNVPQFAAQRLAGHIDGRQLTRMPGAGHYWIIESRNMGEVLTWLSEASLAGPGRSPGTVRLDA